MEYIVLHVTEEDLRRAVLSTPERLRAAVKANLPKPGHNVWLSPYSSPCGCVHLGVFATEREALAFTCSHTPDATAYPGSRGFPPEGKTMRLEARRPLKYGAWNGAGFPGTCDRCGAGLSGHNLSWFTLEAICPACADAEDATRRQARAAGVEDAMEGCGFLPGEEDIAREGKAP